MQNLLMQQLLSMAAVRRSAKPLFFTVLLFIIHHSFIFLSFYQIFTAYPAHRLLWYYELPHCTPLVHLHSACASHLVSNSQRFRVFPPAPLARRLVLALCSRLRTWEALGSCLYVCVNWGHPKRLGGSRQKVWFFCW